MASSNFQVNIDGEAFIHARDDRKLVERWWDASRPRKRGAMPKVSGSAAQFHYKENFAPWLAARGLSYKLEKEQEHQGFAVYRLVDNILTPEQEHWEQAFHGTRWYGVWSILTAGYLLASDNKAAGHDFWAPGVYCTPNLSTACEYAIPHIVFADNIYHRIVMELRVDIAQRSCRRKEGGEQWVFPESGDFVWALWFQSNAPPDVHEFRFDNWDPDLEAIPPKKVIRKRKIAETSSDAASNRLSGNWDPDLEAASNHLSVTWWHSAGGPIEVRTSGSDLIIIHYMLCGAKHPIKMPIKTFIKESDVCRFFGHTGKMASFDGPMGILGEK